MCIAEIIVLSFLTGISPSSPSSVITEADDLWTASKFSESNTVLEKLLASDPRNTEALWRTARNYYDIGENLPVTEKDKRYNLYVLAEDYGRRCQKTDPDCGHCYFWIGVGMGRQGTVKGLLSQTLHAKEIRDSWLKAARIQKQTYRSSQGTYNIPGDCYLALGIFYRLTPDWWIAKTMLGFKGSIDTSVDYLRKAITYEPERMEYLKELGVSLLCRGTKFNRPGDIEEGNAFLMKTQALPILKAHDRIDREHAPLIMSNPDMACAYSRDGQQEISEEEARKLLKNPQ